MKKVEFLFPELCNIYAEAYNIEYLARCSDEIQVINTRHNTVPAFVNEDVDMIYIGCLTERKQEQVIEILRHYRDRLLQLINNGVIFLLTGNAVEMFGDYIMDGDRKIPALQIFHFHSVRYMDRDRHNSQYVGTFTDEITGETITMLGHRSQFSFAYGEFDATKFIDIEIGIGMNPDTKAEGINIYNFFATYSLGPYLIMNPPFTKYILRKLGLEDSLEFEKEAMEAYEYRKNELIANLGSAQ